MTGNAFQVPRKAADCPLAFAFRKSRPSAVVGGLDGYFSVPIVQKELRLVIRGASSNRAQRRPCLDGVELACRGFALPSPSPRRLRVPTGTPTSSRQREGRARGEERKVVDAVTRVFHVTPLRQHFCCCFRSFHFVNERRKLARAHTTSNAGKGELPKRWVGRGSRSRERPFFCGRSSGRRR